MNVIAFHEKPGRSQVDSLLVVIKAFVLPSGADAIVPSALFVERFVAPNLFLFTGFLSASPRDAHFCIARLLYLCFEHGGTGSLLNPVPETGFLVRSVKSG